VAAVLKTPKGLTGFLVLALILFVTVFADSIAPFDPLSQSLRARHAEPSLITGEGPYLLGADHVGRDILSRIIYGARISVLVGLSAVAVSGVLGTLIGLVAGFYGGLVGATLMRIADIKLAMPMILFAIAWIAFFGPGLISVIIVIGVWGWVPYGRYVRGMVLFLREAPFVQASIAMGAGNGSLIFRHIAPNLIGPVIVLATLQLGEAVLLESVLSFLGVGVQPPTPTWGSMVADGRSYVDSAWWTVTFPGIAITVFVLGSNFLGDALRDVLDPRSA
jgi:peptide/nickel transport system permease protein